MPGQRAGIHAQCVFEQFADVQRFGDAVGPGIGLLGGNDVLDMVDALAHLPQFVGHLLLFLGDGADQLIEITGQ
ncbi:hypothetical protein D3C81_1430290 [compost metagenome]